MNNNIQIVLLDYLDIIDETAKVFTGSRRQQSKENEVKIIKCAIKRNQSVIPQLQLGPFSVKHSSGVIGSLQVSAISSQQRPSSEPDPLCVVPAFIQHSTSGGGPPQTGRVLTLRAARAHWQLHRGHELVLFQLFFPELNINFNLPEILKISLMTKSFNISVKIIDMEMEMLYLYFYNVLFFVY